MKARYPIVTRAYILGIVAGIVIGLVLGIGIQAAFYCK